MFDSGHATTEIDDNLTSDLKQTSVLKSPPSKWSWEPPPLLEPYDQKGYANEIDQKKKSEKDLSITPP